MHSVWNQITPLPLPLTGCGASLTCKLQWAGPSGGGREDRVILSNTQKCGGQRCCWVALTPAAECTNLCFSFPSSTFPLSLFVLLRPCVISGIRNMCALLTGGTMGWYSGSLVLAVRMYGGDKTFPLAFKPYSPTYSCFRCENLKLLPSATVSHTQICSDLRSL